MMKIINPAIAGTLESSDCMVTVQPLANEGDVQIDIESVVKEQYGDAIEKVVLEMVKQFDVTNVSIKIQDKGAYDCVIAARLETAFSRGAKEGGK